MNTYCAQALSWGRLGSLSAYLARHLATREGDGEVNEEYRIQQETMAVVLEEREDAALEGNSKGEWGGCSRQRDLHVHSHHSVTVCGKGIALQT